MGGVQYAHEAAPVRFCCAFPSGSTTWTGEISGSPHQCCGQKLGLTPGQLGVLLSAFFWTYSLMQPLAGWLVDRYDVYRLYAAGFALWSVAVAAGGLAGGFGSLLVTRLILGAGESLAYPAYSRMLAGAFPEGRRGFANAMLDAGTKAGPALGTLLGALVISHWGWRPFFFVMGAASLLWLAPWNESGPRAIPCGAGGSRRRSET